MQLVPENRTDKNGRVVRKWVRPIDAPARSAAAIPAVAVAPPPSRRRAFKPTETQLQKMSFGIGLEARDEQHWGEHIIHEASPELRAVPFTEDQRRRASGNWVRFSASEVEYYSVLSAVGPYDAINLLHRGVHSAEQAREFLGEHGLGHLAQDNSAVCEELLRLRVRPNMALVYLQKIRDYGAADPRLAAEWVALCAKQSILDKAGVIRDEMLSGAVTTADLKKIGAKALGHDPATIARAVIRWKESASPGYVLEDMRDVVEHDIQMRQHGHTTKPPRQTLEPALAVLHYHGRESLYRLWGKADPPYWAERTRMIQRGAVNEKRLADIALFAAEVNYPVYGPISQTVIKMFDTGIPAEEFRHRLDAPESKQHPLPRRFELALEMAAHGVPPAVSNGWL